MMDEHINEEWVLFRCQVTAKWLEKPLQTGHINMALDVIQYLLLELFQEPSPSKLLHSAVNAVFFSHITSTFQDVVAKKN